jgi:hypothetical protein
MEDWHILDYITDNTKKIKCNIWIGKWYSNIYKGVKGKVEIILKDTHEYESTGVVNSTGIFKSNYRKIWIVVHKNNDIISIEATDGTYKINVHAISNGTSIKGKYFCKNPPDKGKIKLNMDEMMEVI